MVYGPPEFDRIQRAVLLREAEIFCGVGLGVGVVKCTFHNGGRAFAVNLPGASSVDSLSIHVQPPPNLSENLLHPFGDCAIGTRPDIKKQIPVLADNVNELMNYKLRRLKSIVLDPSPGFIADRSVRLPRKGADARKLASFKVEDG